MGVEMDLKGQTEAILEQLRVLPPGGKISMISRHLENMVKELDRNPVMGMRWLRLLMVELNRKGWGAPDG